MAIRELVIPTGIEGDDRATEMIRIWLAHENIHISLNLGMWEDADDSEIKEEEAWGELLSDVIKHISNGLNQSHGWDKIAVATNIRESLLSHLARDDGVVEGKYVESDD